MDEKPIREEPGEYSPPNRSQKVVTGLVVVGLCAVLAYAIVEHHSMKRLSASRDALSAAVNEDQTQIQTLSQKLVAAESAAAAPAPAPAAAPAPAPSVNTQPEQPAAQPKPSTAKIHHRKHHTVAKAHASEDPWRKEFQAQLAEQQKQIAQHQQEIDETKDSINQTRDDLQGSLAATRDDLNGTIAKNHDELVALERKGERNFYEFNLAKSKQFQREGPLSISLRKSNSKHEYCDLVLIVNDSEVSKKHVNLYEPVLFYPEGYTQPLQVVINSIGKGSARGYVSELKYKPSEPATSASAASSEGTAPGAAGRVGQDSSTDATGLQRRPAAQP